ncbi:HK97 family phage major capsid protein [Variovorax paradoxus]|uniref:phage major capsid protein n=1 Tax=Variovorax paradoxus TaxID=34073 RepID=UPI002789213A|nr:phage major capsid protein [Variovorax paradoxus]MDQ0027749.1 HK97 family phage major capsid protein [Variovorax paradoxus]
MNTKTTTHDPRGLAAARYAKAMFSGRDNADISLAYAESQNWRDTPHVASEIKALVDAMTVGNNPGILGQVGYDFSAFVRPLTLIGRMEGFRRVPLRVRLLQGIGGSTAYWVGEGQAKPISKQAFGDLWLDPLKVVSICVATQELLKFSNPKADETLQDDMQAAAVESIDLAFIDPLNAGVSGVRPASITYDATPTPSSGSSIAQIDSDLKGMVGALTTAGSNLAAAVWIMSPTTAVAMSLKRGAGGNLAYPGVTAKGGELLGLPVLTTPHMGGDTTGEFIALVDASAIALGDEDQTQISVSTQGSLQLSDAPTQASTAVVSLWQTNTAALKVERFVNWQLRRPEFVSVLSEVAY